MEVKECELTKSDKIVITICLICVGISIGALIVVWIITGKGGCI